MRGGALPPALACAALGLALAFVPPKARVQAAIALVLGGGVAALVAWPPWAEEAAFVLLWGCVIASGASVHWRGGVPAAVAVGLGLASGLAAGAVVAMAGTPGDLALALPLILLWIPAGWAVARGYGIAPKVLASWLIAIAVLSAALPLIPTPGYEPDHME